MQNPPTRPPPGGFTGNEGVNTAGAHWVPDAAVHWLDKWVRTGHDPPTAPRLEVTSWSPVVFAIDAYGHALGGVRAPQVDAPVVPLTGSGNTGSGSLGVFSDLFCSTIPFTPAQLAVLYPTHGWFVTQRDAAVERDQWRG